MGLATMRCKEQENAGAAVQGALESTRPFSSLIADDYYLTCSCKKAPPGGAFGFASFFIKIS